MIIRNYQETDLDQLKLIHERYYKEEFSINEFYQNFLALFSVVDNDKIVSVGGVRTIAESVIVTDKGFSARQRREALLMMLQSQAFVTGRNGFSQLHAFVQDENWERQLIEYGFKPCKGNAVYIGV